MGFKIIQGVNGAILILEGKPNDGTIPITVLNLQFLTGNPYPSAIDLSSFLIEQTNCTGIAYLGTRRNQ
jgi:hypothetical protein